MAQVINEQAAATGTASPRKMLTSDHGVAAAALGRAFYDDPLMMYFLEDDAKRAKLMPRFMTSAIKMSSPEDELYTTAGTPEGAALFLPPGKTVIPVPRVAKIMIPELPRYGLGTAWRIMGVLNEMEHLHPKEPHWYLFVLGVDPPRQGQGLGGVLMSSVLARADADKLPVYLETMKPKNVPFYEKHGFAVQKHFHLAKGKGPETWTMLRAAR